MTQFIKSEFQYHNGWLTYQNNFVARFKYRSGPIGKAKFLKELIANHSTEDYFAAKASGKAPLEILRDANEDWFYGLLGMK